MIVFLEPDFASFRSLTIANEADRGFLRVAIAFCRFVLGGREPERPRRVSDACFWKTDALRITVIAALL